MISEAPDPSIIEGRLSAMPAAPDRSSAPAAPLWPDCVGAGDGPLARAEAPMVDCQRQVLAAMDAPA